MSELAGERFALNRLLVVGRSIDHVLSSECLSAFIGTRASKPLALTVLLQEHQDVLDARRRLASFCDAVGACSRCHKLEVATSNADNIEKWLCRHDALLPTGGGADGRLIVQAWQHGLCVVNAPDQARTVANFEDWYFQRGSTPGRPWYARMEGEPRIITNPQRIVLEYGARINPRSAIFNESTVTIGRGSLLGADAELNLFRATLAVGKFCQISSAFTAVGSRHTLHFPATFAVSRGPFAFLGQTADRIEDIVIGNEVWFGTRVIVLPGIHVADGVIVGAGSVVTKSLTEPYGIYAGNPARLIRYRFPPHVIDWLLSIQWWNWSTDELWRNRTFFTTDISTKTTRELSALIES